MTMFKYAVMPTCGDGVHNPWKNRCKNFKDWAGLFCCLCLVVGFLVLFIIIGVGCFGFGGVVVGVLVGS